MLRRDMEAGSLSASSFAHAGGSGTSGMVASVVTSQTVKVGFLLLDNFSMIAFTSAVEPLRLANRLAGTLLYDWVVISKDGEPVSASNGIAVSPGFSIADVENPQTPPTVDMAFVCSGLGV